MVKSKSNSFIQRTAIKGARKIAKFNVKLITGKSKRFKTRLSPKERKESLAFQKRLLRRTTSKGGLTKEGRRLGI